MKRHTSCWRRIREKTEELVLAGGKQPGLLSECQAERGGLQLLPEDVCRWMEGRKTVRQVESRAQPKRVYSSRSKSWLFCPLPPPPICPDAAVESQRWRSRVTRREESLECTRRLLVTLIGRDAIAGVPQFPRPLSVSQHISWHAVPVNNCVAVHWLAPRRRAHFNLLAARIDCQAQRIPHKQTPGSPWVVTASRQRRTTVRSHSKKRVKDLIDFFFLDNNWLNVWWAVVSKLVIYLNTYNKTLESNKYEIIWINLNICLQICANLNILNIFGPCKKKFTHLSHHFISSLSSHKKNHSFTANEIKHALQLSHRCRNNR